MKKYLFIVLLIMTSQSWADEPNWTYDLCRYTANQDENSTVNLLKDLQTSERSYTNCKVVIREVNECICSKDPQDPAILQRVSFSGLGTDTLPTPKVKSDGCYVYKFKKIAPQYFVEQIGIAGDSIPFKDFIKTKELARTELDKCEAQALKSDASQLSKQQEQNPKPKPKPQGSTVYVQEKKSNSLGQQNLYLTEDINDGAEAAM